MEKFFGNISFQNNANPGPNPNKGTNAQHQQAASPATEPNIGVGTKIKQWKSGKVFIDQVISTTVFCIVIPPYVFSALNCTVYPLQSLVVSCTTLYHLYCVMLEHTMRFDRTSTKLGTTLQTISKENVAI